ncbi:MAG: transcriptional regulator [Pseudomonadota bacterium]
MSFDYKLLTGAHVKAARGLISWTQDDLERESTVSKRSINNIEKEISITDRLKRDIVEAFEREGIEFLNSDAPGVRLHKKNTQE